jgi:hypothetical protein
MCYYVGIRIISLFYLKKKKKEKEEEEEELINDI